MAGKPKITRTESSFSDQVPLNRSTETRRDNDTVNTAKVSLYDIDSAIIKYIDQNIAPTVSELDGSNQVKVPTIYASPEKWVSIQRDRYYRDAKNKIFAPLIAIRRESFDFNEAYPKYVKDRDAFAFETKYNKQNRYDKFSQLNGVKPIREFHVVDMPRYVTVQYNLIIWTELMEQLNGITELFSYHSGLAWGDTFKFTSTISNFQFENINVTEQDRVVRATTTITVSGYLIPDNDKKTETHKKLFSKSKIIFDSAERGQIGGAALANYAESVDLTDVLIFDRNNDFVARVPAGSTYRIPDDFITTESFYAFTASYNTGSFTGSFTGKFTGDGSQLTGIVSSKWTGSNPITRKGNVEISGSLTVSGSTTFTNIGPAIFSGSVVVTSGITGSLRGTASWAENARTASYVNPLHQQVVVSGSLLVTGGITASLFGTASWAGDATNAFYAATASNILGGKATHVPFFITDTSLATSSIYQSGSSTVIINQDNATSDNPEALYVYQPSTSSFNVISGKGNLNNYLQLNIQNTNNGANASSDVVATANNGNESINYIDMGINNENYNNSFIGGANDAYLYSTGRYLHIGNTSNFPVQIFVGGSDVDIHNKLELNPNNQHLMSGSLDVSGSIKAFSFTGSLQGNATSATTSQTSSYSTTLGASLSQPANNQVRLLNSAGGTLSTATINNVISASHANNASTADYAAIAGNGGVSQIIAGSGVTLIPSSGQGNVTVIATGVGGVTIISGSLVTGSFINTNSYTFNHNLNTRTPIITVFDSNYNQIIPENIQLVDSSSAIITFPTLESGFAIGSTGGTTGTALSSSYALIAEYASTASFYAETDPIFVAKSGSLATTGSNTFRGNQIISGSLIVSGSGTFTNIGPALFTGSVNITGSTTQTGNNTLIGNTVLSGSISISGSSNIQGTTTMTGSLNITGSTTQTGNNTLIGTTTLTGSILINGNIIPEVSSSFDLGSETNPWRSLYVQSGSISIQSDIPGGIPATISNANGDVTIAGAGLQLKSGSFVPFEVSSTARTIIRVPNLPANDVGGLSIIGSSTGAYQPVTNAGGLLHLTSNDGASSRITSDAYGTAANATYVGRKARGTAASPLPVQSGDVLTRISSIGWTGTDYGFTMSASLTTAPTSIDVVALENYTTSSFGSRFNFYSVPTGSTVRTLSAQIDTTGITIPSTSRFFGTASWAENALTASYVQNAQTASYVLNAVSSSYASTASFVQTAQTASYVLNAVSSSFASTASYVNPLKQDVIITGSLKVSGSLTEIGDTILTGSLTLSSGSRLNVNDGFYVNGNKQFNYGQFSSTQTQSGSADTAYSATFDTTDFSQGVSLVSGSRITVSNTGLYNIQFSSQLHTTANQAVDFSIWFAMTGSNIANSNTDFTIEKIAGGGYVVAALNFLTRITSGSYVELKYSKTTDQGQLLAQGTQSTPTRPATPSVIVTVTQIA
jgi:hypothetical protein